MLKRVEGLVTVTGVFVLGVTFGLRNAAAQAKSQGVIVLQDNAHAVSPPVERIPPIPPEKGVARVIPLLPTHAVRIRQLQRDPVLQTSATSSLQASAGTGFTGIGVGLGSFSDNYIPPDTNGAAGPTQYVQWVNASLAVFDKSTGKVLLGPVAGNTIWQALGGPCYSNNSGDPIAQYDKQDNRWVLMQPVFTSPYYLCIAVSQNSDATGSYNLYQFPVPNNTSYFPDYPKLAVWPEGYFISFNTFHGNTYLGPTACVVDKSAMLADSTATIQCTNPLGSGVGPILPADLDGDEPALSGTTGLPPDGTTDYYLNFGTNSLGLFEFHVDWTISTNSSFQQVSSIPVATFSEACGGGACVPQYGTRQVLDSLGDRLMYRLAYRNFNNLSSSYEDLVVSQSVDTGNGNTGVRWYELRQTSNSSFSVYQQGTYAPDSTYRWMPSIAMDKSGDIAVGYSVSSSGMNPAIRFAGRAPGDTLGNLETEANIVSGAGSQTHYNRWGDYSSMSVDPSDDCTLWYTNEYLKTTGDFNWSTQITPIKFSGCGTTASPSFALSSSPSSLSVAQGSSGTSTITVTPSGGYTGTVNLAVSGCPTGATCSLNSNSVTISGTNSQSVTLTVSPASSTPTGPYTVTVTGTDSLNSSLTSSTAVSLTVNPASTGGSFTLGPAAGTISVAPGSSAIYTITTTPSGGFSGSVSLSVSGLPKFVNGSFSPNPVSVSGTTAASSTLTVTANKHAKPSQSTLTVTGTGGGQSSSVTVTLNVT